MRKCLVGLPRFGVRLVCRAAVFRSAELKPTYAKPIGKFDKVPTLAKIPASLHVVQALDAYTTCSGEFQNDFWEKESVACGRKRRDHQVYQTQGPVFQEDCGAKRCGR